MTGRTAHELLREAHFHFGLAAEHAARGLEEQVVDAVCFRISAGSNRCTDWTRRPGNECSAMPGP